MIRKFESLGVLVPEILLPNKNIDMTKWSVVACDQYTSQPEYWTNAKSIVGENPSTLNIVLPEVYLEQEGVEQRIEKINQTMERYLNDGILVTQSPGFTYVDRQTSHSKSRKGLIIAIDLEKYDYTKGSQSLIRATEGTVVERLPPRVKIRQNAPIESPHVMLLIDDEDKLVIEPLAEKLIDKLYDFDLMLDGGHVKGYKVDDEEILSGVIDALQKLADPKHFKEKYKVEDGKSVLLFAVGDGNHSLASAKVHWENIKKALPVEEAENHPSRYALVEVVNVHDEGLNFEPIHRVVFNIDPEKLISNMVQYFNNTGSPACASVFDSKEAMEATKCDLSDKSLHVISYKYKDTYGFVTVNNPRHNLEVGTLQCFLDELACMMTNIKIDYIHGEEVVDSISSNEGNIGFYLPSMNKRDLFRTVILDGALPRKTFSMGEAEEKRFYLECRKIKG